MPCQSQCCSTAKPPGTPAAPADLPQDLTSHDEQSVTRGVLTTCAPAESDKIISSSSPPSPLLAPLPPPCTVGCCAPPAVDPDAAEDACCGSAGCEGTASGPCAGDNGASEGCADSCCAEDDGDDGDDDGCCGDDGKCKDEAKNKASYASNDKASDRCVKSCCAEDDDSDNDNDACCDADGKCKDESNSTGPCISNDTASDGCDKPCCVEDDAEDGDSDNDDIACCDADGKCKDEAKSKGPYASNHKASDRCVKSCCPKDDDKRSCSGTVYGDHQDERGEHDQDHDQKQEPHAHENENDHNPKHVHSRGVAHGRGHDNSLTHQHQTDNHERAARQPYLHENRNGQNHSPRRRSKVKRARKPTANANVLCKCCVDRMFGSTPTMTFKDVLAAVAEQTERVRQCCIALAGICCPGPRPDTVCCTDSDSCEDGAAALMDVAAPDEAADTTPGAGAVEDGSPKRAKQLTFALEFSGLHCPDCMGKVRKVAAKLDGVKVLGLDNLRGTAQMGCSPDGLSPDAIARFIAKATGLGVTLAKGMDSDAEHAYELPVALAKLPPQAVLDALDHTAVAAKGPGGVVTFTLRPAHKGTLLPRELLDRLKPYGPTLVEEQDPAHRRIKRDLRSITLRTVACAVLTIPILVLVWAPQLPDRGSVAYRSAEFALGTAVIALAWPMYKEALLMFWYLREADLGLLVAVSTLTAYGFSVVAFACQVAGRYFSDPFFETVGLLITLILVGRTLQALVRSFTATTLFSLASLQPKVARLLNSDKTEEEIDVRVLHLGDTLALRAGDTVPTDGIVVSGRAEVDEAAVTGESVPVAKSMGGVLTAGTRVLDGSVAFSATHLVSNNSLTAMRVAVEAAQTSEGRYADLADRFSAYLLPLALAAAVVSFLVWTFVSHYVRRETWSASAVIGVKYGISVLAVSCPCALALAVTSVTSVTLAMALREGIVFRTPDALRRGRDIDVVAFDKTGTLSQNKLAVVSADVGDTAAALVHCLTAGNKHPVSRAVYEHSAQPGLATAEADMDPPTAVPGGGIQSTFLGAPLRGGSAVFTGTTQHPKVRALMLAGVSVFVVTLDARLIGLYGLADVARPDAARAVAALRARGKDIAVVSGDNPAAVMRFAGDVGVDPANTHGGCSPAGKAAIVDGLKVAPAVAPALPSGTAVAAAAGAKPKLRTVAFVGDGINDSIAPKLRTVAFVGDGINDSIALATADVSVAIGSGTDAAVSASSIIFLGHDLDRMLRGTLDLSANFNVHAVLGLVWCGVYFLFAILLVGGAFVTWSIPPSYAGLGEVISVLPVLAIAASAYVARRVQLWCQARRERILA